ncbi:MAG: M20 family metallopeptidase [Pseudomonadota bacterium]
MGKIKEKKDMNSDKKKVNFSIDALKDELVAISQNIYENPEEGLQEFNASKKLCDYLASHDFEITTPIANLDTAFTASYSNHPDGPVIALLAEYDALPGLGHACGHNLIGTAAVGAAVALRQSVDFNGTILVIGCPAEEAGVDGAGGKVVLVENGCFKSINLSMIFHPMPLTMVGGETAALIGLEFRFKGKAAHSAGNPWDGLNALDGVLQMYNAINALRQHVREDVRIHGIITHGGEAPNIVPEYAAARFFIRSQNNKCLHETIDRVKNCAKGAAISTGTELEVKTFCNFYESMKSNTVINEVYTENLKSLGFWIEGIKKGKGSTDVGNVSRVVPTSELGIRLGHGIVPHTREFLKAAGSKKGYEVMILGAKILAMSAIDFFQSPELLQKAQEEFKKV